MFSHMQAKAIAEGDKAFNRRHRMRKPVRVYADLRKRGRTPFRVTVIDLSELGCRCDTTSKTMVGDRIWLNIVGLAPVEAEIRWSDHRGFGAEWMHPFHPSVIDHICKAYPGLMQNSGSSSTAEW